jgi:ubiquinone/menaquinone biosynthesis C-methylase UbiE
MYSRAAWTTGFALIMYYNSRIDDPGPSARVLAVLLLIAAGFIAAGFFIRWLNTTGQAQVREQVLDAAQFSGSERVLDAGGTLGIAAAKRLKSGKVIALGETAFNETERETAKREGVFEKVRFEPGLLEKLSYPNDNFDVVLASRAIAGRSPADAAGSLAELVRVLKPGGRLVLHEIGDAGLERSLPEQPVNSVSIKPSSLPLNLGGKIYSASKRS